ncbi:MAG: 3-hydroxyacyl-CoA dehydrogenase [Corynebacterium sp.]|nr:3-hydroxyacyl-CoA dehydrogenase [Corynebacterium sp.]
MSSFSSFNTVTVLGAGNLGTQIAFRVAYFGYTVISYDIDDAALAAAAGRFDAIAERYAAEVDGATPEKLAAARANITQTADLVAAVATTDLVIEAVPENLELKKSIYAKIGAAAPAHTVFLTNSSSLPPSAMAESTGRPDKFMAFHFANGIHRISVVEVMPTPSTAQETYDAVAEFAPTMGMHPILLHKEQPGYIINTLLIPWLDAAAHLWVKGVADVATVDSTAAMVTGSPQFSPFRVYDTVGFGVAYAISSQSPDPVIQKFAAILKERFIDQGKVGVETHEGFYHYGADGQPTGLTEAAKKPIE